MRKVGVSEDKMAEILNEYEHREEYTSVKHQLENVLAANYEQMPLLITDEDKLKLKLLALGDEFGIQADITIDKGHSYIYQVTHSSNKASQSIR